jgi:hypothetical protein
VSITNQFHQLKGRRNAGEIEMEVSGECGACGQFCTNSIFGPPEELTITTKSDPGPPRRRYY